MYCASNEVAQDTKNVLILAKSVTVVPADDLKPIVEQQHGMTLTSSHQAAPPLPCMHLHGAHDLHQGQALASKQQARMNQSSPHPKKESRHVVFVNL